MTSRGFFHENMDQSRYYDQSPIDQYQSAPQDLSMSSIQSLRDAELRYSNAAHSFTPTEPISNNEVEKEPMDSGEVADLICTEAFPTEEQLHTHPAKDDKQKPGPKPRTPARRTPKPKSPASTPAQSIARFIDKEKKAPSRMPLTEKRKQNRGRKQEESGVSVAELTIVDEMSIVPVDEIKGDMDFEDLEPEDLELIRHLPPPGNVRIGSHCAEAVQKMKEFERKLQDALSAALKNHAEDDIDHDSDATLSIASDDVEDDAPRHSVNNPTTDMAMLRTYNRVFDPPVPAVVTIPTSIVSLRTKNDWETEAKAVQYLLSKNNKDRTGKDLTSAKKRKRELSRKRSNNIEDKDILRLITAIEIKSNQVVHLKSPVFSLQYPPDTLSKSGPAKVPDDLRSNKSSEAAARPPSSDKSRIKVQLAKLQLDTFCAKFLEDAQQQQGYTVEEEVVGKTLRKKIKLEQQWKQKAAYKDQETEQDFAASIGEIQQTVKELKSRKERAIAVAQEKFLLDEDEIEKRFNTSTEKARSHVINMFEENRRQYELQRTLDFATCKCDLLSINTRNMRRREVQPRSGGMEELPVGTATQNPSSSPNPHAVSANPTTAAATAASAGNFRRRRTNFAAVLKETLDDREIYDDLNNVSRVIREDAHKSRQFSRTAQVTVEGNRLTIDGKTFQKGQLVSVEHHEIGRYPGTVLMISRTEIRLERLSDGTRDRFSLGLLTDKRLVLRRRGGSMRSAGTRKPLIVVSTSCSGIYFFFFFDVLLRFISLGKKRVLENCLMSYTQKLEWLV